MNLSKTLRIYLKYHYLTRCLHVVIFYLMLKVGGEFYIQKVKKFQIKSSFI